MASNRTKKEHIAALFRITQKYDTLGTRVMAKLDELNIPVEEFNITVDEFNEYDSLMVSQNVVEPPSMVDKYPDIPGFTQTDKYSDSEVIKIFEARDSLQNVLDEIGEPPTDAEWFPAGRDAEERISELRPFYETRKAEEWRGLESALPAPFGRTHHSRRTRLSPCQPVPGQG